ncbi:hypothetical protein FSP39_015166 [Pinctada imbricata]|uniref:Uncharacterized protein n=1 Tax=Pinctada imbricata TaxID=66713 RepID=A0AA88XUT9_PINIB|nr:hypothetical protein FSP39_015166 [Pinctada imbricata]
MPPARGVIDDLARLGDLTEEAILEELRARYDKDVIYTYIGDILVSVNPNRPLPIYGEQVGADYATISELRERPPHAYAIASLTYRNLLRSKVNQCILVSGESGAGKTECTKMMIAQAVRMTKTEEMMNLHDKIIEVNPVLEAFGNAQTVLNNNSSRFGKLVELEFTGEGGLLGARITEHMLEKSRVVHHGHGERTFHIFYYMFAGLTDRERKLYFLGRPEKFRIVDPSHGMPVFQSQADFDVHRESMDHLREVMKTVGFSTQVTEIIFAIVAGIIHLCNIEFAEDPEARQVIIVNEEALDYASRLLSVQGEDMVNVLLAITAFVRGERMVRLKTVSECCDGRDALAKALYSRLFSWIVRHINEMLDKEGKDHRVRECGIVSILDMAGFENFPVNSFEQLCINVANEQLQFYFNSYIFSWELSEYEEEDITPPKIKFINNKDILNLFLRRPDGVFSMLEDECRLQTSTDLGLVEKMNKQFNKHDNYKKTKGREAVFTVIHYAGQVQYKAHGFIEKNRETLGQNFLNLMENSHNGLINELFTSKITDSGTLMPSGRHRQSGMWDVPEWSKPNIPALGPGETLSRRQGKKIQKQVANRPLPDFPHGSYVTISQHFTKSLSNLMEKLSKGEPHFVRCIKANNEQQYGFFDPKLVMDQLRTTGVLETSRIRRMGFPKRMHFEEFIQRYQFIAFPMTRRMAPSGVNCLRIAQTAGLNQCEVGKTKVFLKYWQVDQLESIMDSLMADLVIVQKTVRKHITRNMFLRLHKQKLKDEDDLFIFGNHVTKTCDKYHHMMTSSNNHDKQQYQKQLQERRARESRHYGNSRYGQPKHRGLPRSNDLGQRHYGNYNIYDRPDYMDMDTDIPRRKPSHRIYQECLSQVVQKKKSLDPDAWCKIIYMEYDRVVAKFYILEREVTIDGSYEEFDGERIGLGAFQNEYRDVESEQIRTHVGKGVKLKREADGSITVIKMGKNPVIVKDSSDPGRHCFAPEVIQYDGKLPQGQPIMVFDMEEFKSQMGLMVQQNYMNEEDLEFMSVVGLSFIRDSTDDANTPCWLMVINIRAIQSIGDPDVMGQVQQLIAELALKTEEEVEQEEERKKLALRNNKRRWSKLDHRQGIKGKEAPLRKTRMELMQKGMSLKGKMSYSWEIERQSSKKKQKNMTEIQEEYDYEEPMSMIGGYRGNPSGPGYAASMISSVPWAHSGHEKPVRKEWAKIKVAIKEEKIEEEDAKLKAIQEALES